MYLDHPDRSTKYIVSKRLHYSVYPLSFGREYDLKFAGKIGNVFLMQSIDLAIQKRKRTRAIRPESE